MSGSFSSGGYGRESSSYGGSDRFGGGSQNRAGSDRGQGGRGGQSGVSTSDYMAGKLSGWKKDPTTGGWSNPGFDKRVGIDRSQGGRGGSTFVGNDTTANKLRADQAGVSPDQYNREVTDYAGRVRDSLDSDNSTLDNLGNMVAGFLGFNETPVEDIDFNPQKPTGPRSGWSFDPVGAIVGLGSSLAGGPFGPGLIADQISSYFGRPLAIDLGPSVFGSDTVDETGQVAGSSRTHTGGSMTIQDRDNQDGTFYGAPAGLALLGQGASQAMPSRSTFTGTDPLSPDPAPESPFTPTTPQPGEYEQPNNMQVDAGNTGLTGDQLSGLFSGFLNPSRTAKGRNAMRVVA